ncbi:HAD-IA family hydrolase [Haloferula sargassicola]|uniref:HAD-IA family hydrolase n=1 Tax=Haloferula sargassicola TaxID=490096 RepID=UPI0033657DB6
MIRALLLDAAGTLIDLAEPVGEVYARILSRHGIELPAAELERRFRRSFATLPPPDFARAPTGDEAERAWWRSLVETALDRPLADDAFAALFDHYAQPEAWTVFPEVAEVLERARTLGWKLAVVSNFDRRLHAILAGHGLAGHFEAIISSADAAARKPEPAIFHHALRQLGVAPEQALHAGDSLPLDVEAAVSCGIRAIHIDRPLTTLRAVFEGS